MNTAKDYQLLHIMDCVGLPQDRAKANELEAMRNWAQSDGGQMGTPSVRWLLFQYDILAARLKQRDRVIAQLQAIVDTVPKTADGVSYVPYGDKRTFWALWRYGREDPWRVSPCHVPRDADQRLTGYLWIIEECEEDCELRGVYSTAEAAEAARRTPLQGKD